MTPTDYEIARLASLTLLAFIILAIFFAIKERK